MQKKSKQERDDDEKKSKEKAKPSSTRNRSKRLHYQAYEANDQWTRNKRRRIRRHLLRTGQTEEYAWRDQHALRAFRAVGGTDHHLLPIDPPEPKT
jgi:hypothetical protein